jgi:hypothetical protein
MNQALEARVIQDHLAAVGKLHYCNYVVGYSGDDQIEVTLNPPILVMVDKEASGLMHDTGTHLDPYWDITPVVADKRIAHLRSFFTYGPCYYRETGELEKGETCIWPANLTVWQRFILWCRSFWTPA